ncbi:MAG: ROK family protein [Acidobacteria bacterium]|nr:ROK family protein [Acidobacteriota bacterium]
MRWALGFDIGGTKIEASQISSTGELGRTLRFPVPESTDATVDMIVSMAMDLRRDVQVEGIGFGIPGSLDHLGVLRNAPNSPQIEGIKLGDMLSTRLSGPLYFENDANCLALAEHKFGVAKGFSYVVGVILGTGIGTGVILGDRLFRGAHGWAPEPGHLPLNVQGRICKCGLKGCVEAYLSGPSILARYHECGGGRHVTTTQTLFEVTQDKVAESVLSETRALYTRFLGMLVSVFDPQAIVLGGGLSEQPLFQSVECHEIVANTFGTKETPRVFAAELGAESGKFGAAACVFGRH